MITKQWKEFEKLTAKIIEELSPNARIKWNDKIKGRKTQDERQIDVSIRFRKFDKDFLVIVQARDRSKAADINAVGEFASVIDDVSASRGILVCRSGFTKRALAYARNIGIELINIHDAESKKWKLEISIPILWTELKPTVNFGTEVKLDAGDQVRGDSKGPILSFDEGKTRVNFISTFAQNWNKGLIPKAIDQTHNLVDPRKLQMLVIDKNGKKVWRDGGAGKMTYTVAQLSWLGFVKPEKCRGIIDHLKKNAFIASYLPINQIPLKREGDWIQVEDPSKLAINPLGTIITTSVIEFLDPQTGKIENMDFKLLAPL
jgi:hypothetical protein